MKDKYPKYFVNINEKGERVFCEYWVAKSEFCIEYMGMERIPTLSYYTEKQLKTLGVKEFSKEEFALFW